MEERVRLADNMGGIDVIVSWPRSCDYPLWRQFICDERGRFSRVLAVFTEHSGPVDYTDWLKANCPEVEFMDSLGRRRDWRDAAINTALAESTAERVWFTEQDFFVRDDAFWNIEGSVVGFSAGDGRLLHPASLFVDRKLIDKTSRYFGPEPVDHFYTFAEELARLIPATLLPIWCYEHLQGTTQNHSLIDKSEDTGVFKRVRFRDYLRSCLEASVPLHDGWAERARTEILPEEKLCASF